MFPIINIGPVAIQATGLILLLSLLIGTWLTGKFSEALGTNSDVIENSILIGLLAGILGARIGFMLENPSIFLNNPLSLLSLTPSMLNGNFGILTGGLAAFIIAQKKNLPIWPTLDTLSPLIIVVMAGLHLANFANGNAYGLPTELPWGIELWNASRHPVQLYALFLSAGLFTWLFIHTQGFKTTGFLRSGILFNIMLAGIGAITVFTRAFVAEKALLVTLDSLQVVGFFLILCSLAIIYVRAFQPQKDTIAIIRLGSNVDPQRHLAEALKKIKSEFLLTRSSKIYRTKSVKTTSEQPHFLNQIIEINTNIPFPDFLEKLTAIKREFNKDPEHKNSVTLDLDIVTYSKDVFIYQNIIIPDPNLKKYNYIALPLAEMAPDFQHPGTGESIHTILEIIDSQKKA
jgi:phosphatidylglycerol---prolipoprotein diacylglyceryl transferase